MILFLQRFKKLIHVFMLPDAFSNTNLNVISEIGSQNCVLYRVIQFYVYVTFYGFWLIIIIILILSFIDFYIV